MTVATTEHIVAPEKRGTVAGYSLGCRCPDCRSAKVAYNRRRRQALRSGEAKTDAGRGVMPDFEAGRYLPGQDHLDIGGGKRVLVGAGELAASCWCERGFVAVPKSELNAGLTRACSRPGCKLVDRSARGVYRHIQEVAR